MVIKHIYTHQEHQQDPLTQKRIHLLVKSLLKESTILKPLELFESTDPNEYWYKFSSGDPNEYVNEMLDHNTPIFLSKPEMFPNYIDKEKLLEEFIDLWKKAYEYGFILFNFSLFAQTNGTVIIRHFDVTLFKTTIGNSTVATFPDSSTMPISDLFEHDCFPSDFTQLIGFVSG